MLEGHRIAGMLALDKAEPDYYTAVHAQTAVAYASLVARAILESEGSGAGELAG
jgi:hypothetical protein